MFYLTLHQPSMSKIKRNFHLTVTFLELQPTHSQHCCFCISFWRHFWEKRCMAGFFFSMRARETLGFQINISIPHLFRDSILALVHICNIPKTRSKIFRVSWDYIYEIVTFSFSLNLNPFATNRVCWCRSFGGIYQKTKVVHKR